MRIEFPFILKSRIEGAITRARMDERHKAEKDYDYNLRLEIDRIKSDYNLKLKEKDAEINTLNKVIDLKNKHIESADKKNLEARQMVIKAKEIISICDHSYNIHIENNARVMTAFSDARKEIELFSKKMIEE
jgi:hypothetical protein